MPGPNTATYLERLLTFFQRAADILFDPTGTGLTATTVQDAIVEVSNNVPTLVKETMSELRAVAPIDGRIAWTACFSDPDDGGGGTWTGVTGAVAGTYAHNGGTVIVPVGGNGSAAWLRTFEGAVFPEWFGAKGDGATDDKAALAACFAAAGTFDVCLSRDYLVTGGNLALVSNLSIIGPGTLRVDTATLNPLFTGTSLSAIRMRGPTLVGNSATQTSVSSGSSAFDLDGCSDIQLSFLTVSGWTRHGIALDGVTDVKVDWCDISGGYYGAGVLCAATTVSTRVTVTNCKITDTQLANVHAFVGVVDWVVEDNTLSGTGQGSGSVAEGEVADNITCYPDDLSLVNPKISRNFCRNSANHGIHIGGNYADISDNDVDGQAYIGILFYAGDGDEPNPDAVDLRICGNRVASGDRTDSDHKGISVRNVTGFVLNGNQVTDCYDSFEIRFIDAVSPTGKYTQLGTCLGNTVRGGYRYGIELNGYVRGVELGPNAIDIVDAAGEHIRYNTTDATGRADNPLSSGNVFLGVGTAPRVLNIQQGTASVAPKLKATGSATNINAAVEGKGNGVVLLGNDNGYGAQVSAGTASTVNRVELVGSVSGTAVRINPAGDDTNIRQDVQGKGTGGVRIEPTSGRVGFMGATPIQRPTVTGSRGGNAALASLLTELANLGLITDSTS